MILKEEKEEKVSETTVKLRTQSEASLCIGTIDLSNSCKLCIISLFIVDLLPFLSFFLLSYIINFIVNLLSFLKAIIKLTLPRAKVLNINCGVSLTWQKLILMMHVRAILITQKIKS